MPNNILKGTKIRGLVLNSPVYFIEYLVVAGGGGGGGVRTVRLLRS